MFKITLEKTFIEFGVEGNRLNLDNVALHSSEGSRVPIFQEASVYDYSISYKEPYHTKEKLQLTVRGGDKGIIKPNSIHPNSGAIHTNTYVGTLFFEIYQGTDSEPIDEFQLKVHSVKVNYEEEYQYMLEEISATCADLLLRASSPVNQFLTVDEEATSTSDYQRFKFVESLVLSESFDNAISQILYSPDIHWSKIIESTRISKVKKATPSIVKQISSRGNRFALKQESPLNKLGLTSIPTNVEDVRKVNSYDTPANRFVKFVLQSVVRFCQDIMGSDKNGLIQVEAIEIVKKCESILQHQLFKEVSRISTINLNNTKLQGKPGYRQVLLFWLQFGLASNLKWEGGNSVYSAGKKDVATLYEYWLFFKFLSIMESLFNASKQKLDELIEVDSSGLTLKLKQGKELKIEGEYCTKDREMNVLLCYNSTFRHNEGYFSGGSWSLNLRPDYTLSFWPKELDPEEAEKQELMVHLHFDAKYKVDSEFLKELRGELENHDEKKKQARSNTYKNGDLLKMHAYRDAIRRSYGSYILYPGDQTESQVKKAQREVLPSIGAFSVKPNKDDDGIERLKKHLLETVDNLSNRFSQREMLAFNRYVTMGKEPKKYKKSENKVPESFAPDEHDLNERRGLLPGNTFVHVAYFKSQDHLEWIKCHKMYNFRMGGDNGAVEINENSTKARFLLLYNSENVLTSELFDISPGFKVKFKDELQGYPSPKRDFYMVVENVQKTTIKGLCNKYWDVQQLQAFQSQHGTELEGAPFLINLQELINIQIIDE
ncbi:DUF2357 domain-containing protein [Schleiferiaceae bacterium]|nr:DUF2357 domain-containing protein [Schleiferiaceae bacterium]